MTDNISRMYELAGIKRIYSEFNNGKETVVENVFSHYRQLELIKWIFFNKHKQYLHFFDVFLSYCHGLKFETKEEKRKFVDSEYPQRLAKLVCELWEDLTDTQKEEVRGILQ